MNLCLVAPLPPPYGGIANWTKMLKEYVEEQYCDSISLKVINTAPKKRVTEGRGLFQRIIGGCFGMLRNVAELKRYVSNEKPDCVHITTSGSLSIIRDIAIKNYLLLHRIPYVYHIHFGRIPEISERNTFEWKLIKGVLKKAKKVIAIDKKTFECLDRRGYNCSYIPNPIDLSKMPVPDESIHKKVSFLGWVIKNKGVEELLSAWEKIGHSHLDWELEIVGPYDQAYIDELKTRFDFTGVRLWGEQMHGKAMEILNASDIFVLPSYTEGCPYVIIEAMALAKVVIASNVGNIPEMIGGGCGITINSRDVDGLFDTMVECIEKSEHNNMGKLAQEKVKKEYVIDVILNKYFGIWSEE